MPVDEVAVEIDRYVLCTGEAGADRLRILHRAYGPATRRFLGLAGLKAGMRVADIGCGVGQVTVDLAELVGVKGHVVGVDVSRAQLAQARRVAQQLQLTNVSWVEASALATGLPTGSFDLVYCRYLLLHLVEPEAALEEMHRLLRPGGILVCEDGDVTSAGSEPPSALGAFADLFSALGPTRRVDYTLGRRLYRMVMAAGFSSPDIAFNQPAFARGEEKRFLELSIAEAGPALVEAGLVTPQALRNVLLAMEIAAADETVIAIMPRMAQVSAVKKTA
ncbi:MAG TPA: methyltransferase domain-containing protein [Gemmatimonadales bacterium]|nr:methyltransferase domain-containing protein [Gemmatimonadales bacterium]